MQKNALAAISPLLTSLLILSGCSGSSPVTSEHVFITDSWEEEVSADGIWDERFENSTRGQLSIAPHYGETFDIGAAEDSFLDSEDAQEGMDIRDSRWDRTAQGDHLSLTFYVYPEEGTSSETEEDSGDDLYGAYLIFPHEIDVEESEEGDYRGTVLIMELSGYTDPRELLQEVGELQEVLTLKHDTGVSELQTPEP